MVRPCTGSSRAVQAVERELRWNRSKPSGPGNEDPASPYVRVRGRTLRWLKVMKRPHYREGASGWGLSRRLLNLAERGGSGAQHTALATVVKIAEARS